MAKKMTILLRAKLIVLKIQSFFYLLLNTITAKDEKQIVFIPQETCLKDGYDIINWTGDNGLCLAHYMIESGLYNEFRLIIAVDFVERIEKYEEYCRSLNPQMNITFVRREGLREFIMRAKFIFVSTSVSVIPYKVSTQYLINLNYFTPFRNDYQYNDEFRKFIYESRRNFDYVITTAHLSSRIQALDLGLPLSSFLELGFPRNDIFYRTNKNEFIKYLNENHVENVSKVIMYTPTYRDYETDAARKRDLFGYPDFDYKKLDEILSFNHAVLIVKMHTLQVNNMDVSSIKRKCQRIIFYSEITQPFSLYQCLAETDCLITDYTSVYFDFLHRDRPVIFNYYDLSEYTEKRGLTYKPAEVISAGAIAKTSEQLTQAIENTLNGEDPFITERKILRGLFDCHYDGNSSKRICDYFFSTTE